MNQIFRSNVFSTLFFVWVFLAGVFTNAINCYERPLVIVIASYNNTDWFKQNLDSVFMQKYTNYRVIYIDACSTDGTYDLVNAYINVHGFGHKFNLIRNETRACALENQYNAIHSCQDQEIILILDGDDWFAHENVFSCINRAYEDVNVWITYGQFQFYPTNEIGFCRMMPAEVVEHNSYRSYPHFPSHLRTFYAGLFKKIKKEDLCIDGKFFPMTGDMAAMIPMMEMAGNRFKAISDVLYIYNDINPISDHRVKRELQKELDDYIRRQPAYARLDSLK